MALSATIYHLQIALSDVDRGVYEELDLRLAMHPSETMRYMLTRTIAYCLSYAEGIAFSKGGLSTNEEPPVSIHDLTGVLLAWIDVGSPSADRLHKATKAAQSVSIYTYADLNLLRREAASRVIHKMNEIELWHLQPSFLDELERKIDRKTKLELVRTEGQLYATIGGAAINGTITREPLAMPE